MKDVESVPKSCQVDVLWLDVLLTLQYRRKHRILVEEVWRIWLLRLAVACAATSCCGVAMLRVACCC